jgi:hypothetical protein
MWIDQPAMLAAVHTDAAAGFHAPSYLATVGGKGAVVTGIVEAVANGGMLRVTVLPDFQPITVVCENG